MSSFDPYHKWLGIPPSDQPPNHYRLLGLNLFESDPDVIDVATEQRVTYLRQCATGEHVAESQKLLNEVAAARLCLVNADKKRDYDAQLRSAHESAQENSPRQSRESFARIVTDLATILRALLERHPRAIAVTGVVLLLVVGFFLSPRSDRESDGETNQPKSATSLIGQSAGAEWQTNGLKMPFHWCAPGTFVMGSPKGAKIHYEDEDPVSVSLSRGFWIGKYEVTQAEWREVMGSSPWEGKENVAEGNRYPAVMISWADATLFCRTLTEQERRAGRLPKDWEYRLPTEAQWEYACRAGTETQYSFGNDDDQLVEHAWFMTNSPSLKPVHEVGRKPSNAWGLFDMHGNVTEWCQDGYFSKLSGGNDPEMVLPSSDRVRRGGSVLSQTTACRSAFRGRDVPTRRWFDLGFRVAIVEVSEKKNANNGQPVATGIAASPSSRAEYLDLRLPSVQSRFQFSARTKGTPTSGIEMFAGKGGDILSTATFGDEFRGPIRVEMKVKALGDACYDIFPSVYGAFLSWAHTTNQKSHILVGRNDITIVHGRDIPKLVAGREYALVIEVFESKQLRISVDNKLAIQTSLPADFELRGKVTLGGGIGHVVYRELNIFPTAPGTQLR